MITVQWLSEKGSREKNEDFVRVWQEEGAFFAALADGLGGHTGGEIASALAAEQAARVFQERRQASADCMEECFVRGQERLLEEQRRLGAEFGLRTTLTILMADEKQSLWGHIGDSRIYRFKDGRMVGRTMDHSVPQALASAGEIREDEIRHHPDRSRLLRVMGASWRGRQAYAVSEPWMLEKGQAFLLCSDGFWEWIEDDEMARCLEGTQSAEDWLGQMRQIVEERGAGRDMDNYSAIAVRDQ